jgi:pSer/pThr/pTyr-binding forkhead associated (FHA) protein
MAELLNAGNFRSLGEERAAEVLKDLPEDWSVICNKWLTSRQGTYEVDFIIVGTKNVFVIDEKSWRGRITGGTEENWYFDDKTSPGSPLNKLDMVARIVAGRVREKVLGMKASPAFVTGGVLLSTAERKPSSIRGDHRIDNQVFLISEAIEHLSRLDENGLDLVRREREGIKDCLYDLRGRPKTPDLIGEYRILGTLPAPDDERVGRYLAAHEGSPQEERELTVYRSGWDTESDRNFYLRAYTVLNKLRDTGLSPIADPYVRDEHGSYVVPTARPEGTPYEELRDATSADDTLDELKKTETILTGLNTIHAQGIIHRKIDRRNTYMQEGPEGYRVTFTEFWAARLVDSPDDSEGTIFKELDARRANRKEDSKELAPEIGVSYELADETTDTFAVNNMLLCRILGRDLDDMHGDNGELVLPETIGLLDLSSDEVANDIRLYFKSTLGRDIVTSPGLGTGRMTAVQSLGMLRDIIGKLETAGQDAHVLEDLEDAGGDELDVGCEDAQPPEHGEVPEEDAQVKHEYFGDDLEGGEGLVPAPSTGYEIRTGPQETLFLRHGSVRLEITPDGVSIGRGRSNDLVLDEKRVSRAHALAILEHGHWRLRDLLSTNGTRINGEKISETDLAEGDVIRIGDSEIIVESEVSAVIVCPATGSSCELGCGGEASCLTLGQKAWKITLLSGPQDGLEFEVSRGITSVGRNLDRDIVLKSRTISRKHARIIVGLNEFAVEDDGSSNGTWVNGLRVNLAIIESGETFVIGDTTIKVDRLADDMT